MFSAGSVSQIKAVQHSFQLLSLMQYTAHFFPPQTRVEVGSSFDFIIVGAGTAGCVIANRLTENKDIKVLLVEAGGDPPVESMSPGYLLYLKRSQYDWNYTSEYDEIWHKCHQKPFVEMTLGKMLGGTSSLNYMIYSRGHPSDYDSWAKIVNDVGWKWENVLPYFLKSEKYSDASIFDSTDTRNSVYGTAGSLGLKYSVDDFDDYENQVLDSYQELGHDVAPDHLSKLGYYKSLLTMTENDRASTAWAYLTPIKNRPNLHILKDALVTKINFDENNNAVGVTILTKKKSINVKARKEVIVSAGTLNTPKLLMLSGIGPEEELKGKKIDLIANLPVGKNLQDHIAVVVPLRMEFRDPPPFNPQKYPALTTVGYVALNKTQSYPDYESISYWAHTDLIASFCANAFGFSYKVCDEIYKSGMGRMGYHTEVVHLSPKFRGEVTLRSLHPRDPPVIYTRYLSEPEDLEDLAKYVQDFIPLVNSTHFKSIGPELPDCLPEKCNSLYRWNTEYWKCYTKCLFSGLGYYAGTCAMGSVVDSRLKVLGVNRLRVADASVMPTIVRGNVFGPTVMIGEKVSDMIKEDHNIKQC